MSEHYIGIMSGTSADGIDTALVSFQETIPHLQATHYTPYDSELRKQILNIRHKLDNQNLLEQLGKLDSLLGKAFANAVNTLLRKQALPYTAIKAIGSSGHTIFHHPYAPHPFTWQIGDPNIIVAETGITTITDFRRKDVAYGGQGAPLVPAFHQAIFGHCHTTRLIINLGGIANITFLSPDPTAASIAFDTGPGNTLLDAWITQQQGQHYDLAGQWAQQGTIQIDCLQALLSDPYFSASPPKSTGPEYFNLDWAWQQIAACCQSATRRPVDIQATFTELTAASIVAAIHQYTATGEILLCGGGVHNTFLCARLKALTAPHFKVVSTKEYGLDPDWIEAMAFAWIARQTLHRSTSNLPSVTGAKQTAILGGIYYGEETADLYPSPFKRPTLLLP